MREPGENNVLQLAGLVCDTGSNARVGVPMQVHPPRGHCIENATPVSGGYINSLGTQHPQRRWIERGICEGMPDTKQGCHRTQLLRKSGAVEVIHENLDKRSAVHIWQAWNFANDSYVSVALNGFAVFAILIANEHDSVDWEFCRMHCGKRQ